MRSGLDRGDWLVGLSALAVFIAVDFVANLDKALVAGTICGVFVTIILAKWNSRPDWRVWLILAVFAVIHVVVIVTVRFPHFQAGMVAMPIALVDGFVVWGLINWMEKHFPRRRQ
jgi:hypothetical protein